MGSANEKQSGRQIAATLNKLKVEEVEIVTKICNKLSVEGELDRLQFQAAMEDIYACLHIQLLFSRSLSLRCSRT